MLPLTEGSPVLDLNYLYHRLGVSRLMADRAGCEPSRQAHNDLARSYAARIRQARSDVRRVAA